MKKKIIALYLVFAVISLVFLFVGEDISPLPLGAVPMSVTLLLQASVPLGIAAGCFVAACMVVFVLCMLRGTRNARKIAAGILLMDVALSVFFTLFSLWQLIAVLIDLIVIVSMFFRKKPKIEE